MPAPILTVKDRLEVVALTRGKMPRAEIASRFKVSVGAIFAVVSKLAPELVNRYGPRGHAARRLGGDCKKNQSLLLKQLYCKSSYVKAWTGKEAPPVRLPQAMAGSMIRPPTRERLMAGR